MRVCIDRICKGWKTCLIKLPFGRWPSKVSSGQGCVIYFFPRRPAYVIHEDLSSFMIDGKSKGIAQAQSPYPFPLFTSCGKRIVGWCGSIFVNPQNLAVIRVQTLGGGVARIVAHGNIQFSILSKMQSASVVNKRSSKRIKVQNDRPAARRSCVIRCREAAYSI